MTTADDDAVRPKSEDLCGESVSAEGEDGAAVAEAPDDPSNPEASGADALRAELAVTKERLLRDRAELENYKKRVARDKADSLRFASDAVFRDLLPIIDNLRRAVEHARTSQEVEPIVEGVEMVLRSLDDMLGRHGVREVAAQGELFDPNVHEAIGHVECAEPANTIVDEHQRGYLLHERLLRPALVTVGKGPSENE